MDKRSKTAIEDAIHTSRNNGGEMVFVTASTPKCSAHDIMKDIKSALPSDTKSHRINVLTLYGQTTDGDEFLIFVG